MASLNIDVLKCFCAIDRSPDQSGDIPELADHLQAILRLEGISKLQNFENISQSSIWRIAKGIVEDWDYRTDCLCNLFNTEGSQIVKDAEERVSDRIKTKVTCIQATIYVSAGGRGPGVTYNGDIFLNIKHLVDLTRSKIVCLIAHELVHAKLHYPERTYTAESFVRSILEEGFATSAQLPFDQGSQYHSDWEKYVLEVDEKAKLVDRVITAANSNSAGIAKLYKDFLNGFGLGYAVGFVIVDMLVEDNGNSELDGIIKEIEGDPLHVWKNMKERVSNRHWKRRREHFEDSNT